jgi:hypothetical protein
VLLNPSRSAFSSRAAANSRNCHLPVIHP